MEQKYGRTFTLWPLDFPPLLVNEGVGCGFSQSMSVNSEATFSKTKVRSITVIHCITKQCLQKNYNTFLTVQVLVRVYSGKLFTNQVSQSAKQSVAHATYQHAMGNSQSTMFIRVFLARDHRKEFKVRGLRIKRRGNS